MGYLLSSGHPLPSVCAGSGGCVPAPSRACAVYTDACALDVFVCDGWCYPCVWCVCVTECCLEHPVVCAVGPRQSVMHMLSPCLGTLCVVYLCVLLIQRHRCAVGVHVGVFSLFGARGGGGDSSVSRLCDFSPWHAGSFLQKAPHPKRRAEGVSLRP